MWISKKKLEVLKEDIRGLSSRIVGLEYDNKRLNRIICLMNLHANNPIVSGSWGIRSGDKDVEVNFDEAKLLFSFEYLQERPTWTKNDEPVIDKICNSYYLTLKGNYIIAYKFLDSSASPSIYESTEDGVRYDYFRKDYWLKQFLADNVHYQRETL